MTSRRRNITRDAAIFMLHYAHGVTQRELAAMFELSKSRIHQVIHWGAARMIRDSGIWSRRPLSVPSWLVRLRAVGALPDPTDTESVDNYIHHMRSELGT